MSDTGSVEIGLGLLCLVGAVFGHTSAVESNMLLAAGAALAIYGLCRRKAWNARIGHDMAVRSMMDGKRMPWPDDADVIQIRDYEDAGKPDLPQSGPTHRYQP